MDSNETELQIRFLLNGSYNTLPKSCVKLRSYLSIHASTLASQSFLKLPKFLTNKTMACPFCFFPWSENENSFKLVPYEKKVLKLIEKQKRKEGESSEDKRCQTKNKLVLKCNVCTKKSPFSLLKETHQVTKPDPVSEEPSTKKKKKKKDKFCGLNMSGVLLNQTEPKTSKQEKKKTKNDNFITKKALKVENNSSKSTNPCQSSAKPQAKNSNSDLLLSKKKKKDSQPNKNLVLNPFAAQLQNKSKNMKKKITALQKALEEDKNRPNKSLKDFLTVI